MSSHKRLAHGESHSNHSLLSNSGSVIIGKGEQRLKDPVQKPHKSNHKIKEVNTTMKAFEGKLHSAATITISTKKKHRTENPLMGRGGYVVSIPNDETLGVLLSPSEATCRIYDRDENDPFNYYLINLVGEELMSVYGLGSLEDGDGLENQAIVTTSALKTKVGTVVYEYLGAGGETLSKATSMAGREDGYVEPTSVLDETGDFVYIFRRDQDKPNHTLTEILSADGLAVTLAEVLIDYKTHGRVISKEHSKMEGVAVSLSLNFIETMSEKEKMLMMGVAITLFNQWLMRQKHRWCGCGCTII